jgi:hypothetical protein
MIVLQLFWAITVLLASIAVFLASVWLICQMVGMWRLERRERRMWEAIWRATGKQKEAVGKQKKAIEAIRHAAEDR